MKIVDGKLVAEGEEETAALKAMADAGEAGIAGLKTKNSELLGKLSQFKQFEGIDPEKYRTMEQAAAKIEEDRQLKAGEFDNVKKQIIAAHGVEKAALEAKIESLNKSVTENVLKAQITDAIAKADGSTLLLSPHVASRTKLDDNYHPIVIDESGNVRVKADGTPMVISDLIAEMKLDVANFGGAFKASGASGSGQQPSINGGKSGPVTIKREAYNQMDSTAQAAHFKAGGKLED